VEEDGFSDGAANSSKDEISSDEAERDVNVAGQYGERLEGKSEQTMRLHVTQKSKEILTFEKSTNVSNSHKESLPMTPGVVGIVEEVMGQKEKGVEMAVLDKGEGIDRCVVGGSLGTEDRENVAL
jgi:hypothetical protein